MTTFATFELAAPVLRALSDKSYSVPTPIQARAIPPVLAGRDLLGCAQTGTGKTAAFALPLVHRLLAEPADKSRRGPARARVLVLSPTRELATQIAESFGGYARHTALRHVTVYGGVSQSRQEREMARGVDVLVATPGRLIDLLDQGVVDLRSVGVLVLDEADRMLDMGFIQPIRRIASELSESRQTLMFSATMPREIVRLADSLLRDPVRVSVKPEASESRLIEQSVYMVGREDKQALLEHLLVDGDVSCSVVFTRTKHGADRVSRKLGRAGIDAEAIHGDKSQRQRERALERFRAGRCRVLVATDVAARGLDVSGISHVFNFDLPNDPEAYVHRIGRTGRAGASGVAIAFCDPTERGMLRAIERLCGDRVRVEARPRPLSAGTAPAAVEAREPAGPERRPRAENGAGSGQRRPGTRRGPGGGSGRGGPVGGGPRRRRSRGSSPASGRG